MVKKGKLMAKGSYYNRKTGAIRKPRRINKKGKKKHIELSMKRKLRKHKSRLGG